MYQVLIIFLKTIFGGDAWWYDGGNSFAAVQNELIGAERADTDYTCVNTRSFEQNLHRKVGRSEENSTQNLPETENHNVPQRRYALSHNEKPSFLTDSLECIDSSSPFFSQVVAGPQYLDRDSQSDRNIYNEPTVQSDTDSILTFSCGCFDSDCAHSAMAVARPHHLKGDSLFDWNIYDSPTVQSDTDLTSSSDSAGSYSIHSITTIIRTYHLNRDQQFDLNPCSAQLQVPDRIDMSNSGEDYNITTQENQSAFEGEQTGLNDNLLPHMEKQLHEVPESTLEAEDVWILRKDVVERGHEARGTNLLCAENHLITGLNRIFSDEEINIEHLIGGNVKREEFKEQGGEILRKFYKFNSKFLSNKSAKKVKLMRNVTLEQVLSSLGTYIKAKQSAPTYDELKQLTFWDCNSKTVDRDACLKFYHNLIHYSLGSNTAFILTDREMEGALVEDLYRSASPLCFSIDNALVSSMLDIEKGIDVHAGACIIIIGQDKIPSVYSCSLHSRFFMVVTALIKGFIIE